MKTLSLTAAAAALAVLSPSTSAQPMGQDSAVPGPRHPTAPAPFVAPAPIREIVDRQLGARYGASDREAVARCVTAALAQGAILYGVNGYAGTEGYAAYVGAYRPGVAGVPGFPGSARDHAGQRDHRRAAPGGRDARQGTDRQRRQLSRRLQWSGLPGAGERREPYAIRHPSNNDLVFRCNLDKAGLVTSMHVERHTTTYRRY